MNRSDSIAALAAALAKAQGEIRGASKDKTNPHQVEARLLSAMRPRVGRSGWRESRRLLIERLINRIGDQYYMRRPR